jgi:hypothetical protein
VGNNNFKILFNEITVKKKLLWFLGELTLFAALQLKCYTKGEKFKNKISGRKR